MEIVIDNLRLYRCYTPGSGVIEGDLSVAPVQIDGFVSRHRCRFNQFTMSDFPGVKCCVNVLPQKKRKLVFGKAQVDTLFKRAKNVATPVPQPTEQHHYSSAPSPLMQQLQQQQKQVSRGLASDGLPISVCVSLTRFHVQSCC